MKIEKMLMQATTIEVFLNSQCHSRALAPPLYGVVVEVTPPVTVSHLFVGAHGVSYAYAPPLYSVAVESPPPM